MLTDHLDFLIREKNAHRLSGYLSSIQLLMNPKALLQTCKATPELFRRSIQHALDPRVHMIKALEDIFLSVPTDCLEIVADYISDYNGFDSESIEDLLYETVRIGNVTNFIEAYQYSNNNINSYYRKGKSLLCTAAENGRVEMVKHLLSWGAVNTDPSIVAEYEDALLIPIIAAGRWGHLEVVKILFDMPPTSFLDVLNMPLEPHTTYIYKNDGTLFEFGNVLHWACRYGHTRLIRFLLSKGMDPNVITPNGTIITEICHNDNPRLLREILSFPFLDKSLINFPTRVSPLTITAENNYTEMMLLLIAHGANVNRTSTLSPYSLCCKKGNIKCMKAIEANGFIKEDDRYYLHTAAKSGQVEVIRYLINKGVDINELSPHLTTALYDAVKFGQLKAAKTLLNLGADMHIKTANGRNAFMESITCILSNYEEFIKRGARLDERDKNRHTTSMILIGDYKHYWKSRTNSFRTNITLVRLKRLLDLEKEAGLNFFAETLWYAIRIQSHPDIINLLIEYITYIDEQSSTGDTALHLAIQYNSSPEVIRNLLNRNASIYAENANGQDAFIKALIAKNTRLIEQLMPMNLEDTFYMYNKNMKLVESCAWMYAIEHLPEYSLDFIRKVKGSVYERFKGGPTALILASKVGNKEIINYYAEKNIPDGYLDFVSEDGTALMLAAEGGYESIVKTLVKLGANTNLRNRDGKTALVLSSARGHDCITKYLFELL